MFRPAFLVLTLTLAGLAAARAQVPIDDVGSCALLADPTAQRACLESARQKRPAATFDPSSVKVRNQRNRMPAGDVTGLRSTFGADKHPAAKRKEPAAPGAGGAEPDQQTLLP